MAPVRKHVKKPAKRNKFKPQLLKRKKKKTLIHDEIKRLQDSYSRIDSSKIKTFSDFPLSASTQKGLEENNYRIPTEIQRESIGLALQGLDILGAAQTGSGKTLAFLIPVLENLYCKQWTRLDGVGALIITPTRELAYQIFETLKKVGKHHDFSAGLIIGGKDLHFEKGRMDQCNIIICTPGRILHHMDVNPLFNCSSMQILILDEADRCLDLGFQETMNSIIENLPPKRQTLLFSATQTKSVKDLARLSLKNPRYVSVHEHKEFSTPESLEQSYIVCELHDKINLLWSFIKNHKRQKILIFLSSCKQVKYIYLLFCRLRPGTPLLALYGSLHQLRRMKIYNEFCAKQNVVMFATDIAARGLDFPDVNWVLQLDCPEDANTYIHRAGRTARYRKGGESLLVLLPSEEKAMVEELEAVKIPINKIKVNPSKLMSPVRKIEALVARDLNLKMDAQRAFVAYLKWVYLMKNKKIFRVEALQLEKFAASLGLAVTPRVRFLKRKMTEVTTPRKEEPEVGDLTMRDTSESEDAESDQETKKDWQLSEDEDDILTIKRRNHDLEGEDPETEPSPEEVPRKKAKVVTKAAIAKKLMKKKIVSNKKITFDEEGEGVANKMTDKLSKEGKEYEMEETGGIDIEKAKAVLKAEDKFDKKLFRERIKEKHKTKKRKMKEEKGGEEEEEELKDDFGTDSDSSGPDVSWLPDPDKIYGKEEAEAEGGDNSDGDNSDEDDDDEDEDGETDDDEDEDKDEDDARKQKKEENKQKRKYKQEQMQEKGKTHVRDVTKRCGTRRRIREEIAE